MVGRPCGVGIGRDETARLVEQEQPRALPLRQRLAVDRNVVRRGDVKRRRGDSAPLTVTRPAAIQASASRREARPARAMTLAMRSALACGGGSPAGFGSVVLSLCRGTAGHDGGRLLPFCLSSFIAALIHGPTIEVLMPSFMDMALDEARTAQGLGEVPVGCVIVRDGTVIASAGNRTLTDRDPTAHAEVLAIRAAARGARLRAADRLRPPCHARAVRHVRGGDFDSRASAGSITARPIPRAARSNNGVRFFASPTCHHRPEVYGGIGEAGNAQRCCARFSRSGVDLLTTPDGASRPSASCRRW